MMSQRIRRIASTQELKMHLLGIIVGLLSGLVAVGFRALIDFMRAGFITGLAILGIFGALASPVIAALIQGPFVEKFAPEARGNGVPQVIEAIALEGGRIDKKVPIAKVVASSLTLASGASAGREGPIAQIGAGVASWFGSKLNLNRLQMKTLVVCGAAGGIAATFNAPMGGLLFGLELLMGGVLTVSAITVALSSVTAVAVAQLFYGANPSIIIPYTGVATLNEIPLFLVVGIVLGLFGILWMHIFYTVRKWFLRVNFARMFKPTLGAIVVGMLAIVDVMLFTTPVLPSLEYGFINSLIQEISMNQIPILMLLFALGLKIFGTAFTLGSGMSGGDIAPNLVMGSIIGSLFATTVNSLFPGTITHPVIFAAVGMAGFMAAVAHAPITMIALVIDMTHDYFLIVPLMFAAATAQAVTKLYNPRSMYLEELHEEGIDLFHGINMSVLKNLTARDIMTKKPTILKESMTAIEAIEVVEETKHTKFPVVNDKGEIIGTVIAEDLRIEPKEDGSQYTVAELVDKDFLKVYPDINVDELLYKMIEKDEGHAVVVDPDNPNKMIGFITKTDILKSYRYAVKKSSSDDIDLYPKPRIFMNK